MKRDYGCFTGGREEENVMLLWMMGQLDGGVGDGRD